MRKMKEWSKGSVDTYRYAARPEPRAGIQHLSISSVAPPLSRGEVQGGSRRLDCELQIGRRVSSARARLKITAIPAMPLHQRLWMHCGRIKTRLAQLDDA